MLDQKYKRPDTSKADIKVKKIKARVRKILETLDQIEVEEVEVRKWHTRLVSEEFGLVGINSKLEITSNLNMELISSLREILALWDVNGV